MQIRKKHEELDIIFFVNPSETHAHEVDDLFGLPHGEETVEAMSNLVEKWKLQGKLSRQFNSIYEQVLKVYIAFFALTYTQIKQNCQQQKQVCPNNWAEAEQRKVSLSLKGNTSIDCRIDKTQRQNN